MATPWSSVQRLKIPEVANCALFGKTVTDDRVNVGVAVRRM